MTEVVEKKKLTCTGCTRRFVYLAYQRAPWLRIVREPLKWGMLFLIRFHDFDFEEYEVPSPGCYHCLRYIKNVLKKQSWLFPKLNLLGRPIFAIVSSWAESKEESYDVSVEHARAALAGEPLPGDGDKYIKDPRWYKV